jgi:general secretion pathway protein M
MNLVPLPEGQLGKALAVGIGLVGLFVLQLAVVSPLLSYYSALAQELQDQWDATERSRHAVVDLPQLRATAENLRQKTRDRSLLLDGASDALAAANLQSTLKDMIEQQGSRLVSVQTLQPAPEGRFRRIGLRVAFSGNLTVVTTVLSGIETTHPVLAIENLDLRAAAADENQTLSVAMDVYGYRPQ